MVKEISDANRAVNRMKQTEDAGLLVHAVPLADFRTVSISDAALDLDCPDGSTQGGFMVGFTTPELHQQGSAVMSPMSWSSQKVKRSVFTSLAREVFMMSEGLAECEWISGVLESAIYQDYEPRCTDEIDNIACGTYGDRHEGGQPFADRSVQQCVS